MGPTGELFEPLGALTEEAAIESFRELAEGLKAGGADVAWIETMSAAEEIRAAATGAIAGRLAVRSDVFLRHRRPDDDGHAARRLSHVFDGLAEPPLAIGANCGVGASDILVSLLAMTERDVHTFLISKGNCGVPFFQGTEAVYTGTPELMAKYTQLAVKAGARIVGGCCGTSPLHLAAMRQALDELVARPTVDDIIEAVGPLVQRGAFRRGAGSRAYGADGAASNLAAVPARRADVIMEVGMCTTGSRSRGALEGRAGDDRDDRRSRSRVRAKPWSRCRPAGCATPTCTTARVGSTTTSRSCSATRPPVWSSPSARVSPTSSRATSSSSTGGPCAARAAAACVVGRGCASTRSTPPRR